MGFPMFPMGFPMFSYGFPMFSHGFSHGLFPWEQPPATPGEAALALVQLLETRPGQLFD